MKKSSEEDRGAYSNCRLLNITKQSISYISHPPPGYVMFVKIQLDVVQCHINFKTKRRQGPYFRLVDRKESIKCDADIYSKYKGYAMYQK